MNLFDNILKNVAPKGLNPVGDFMSGFTPNQQTPQAQPTQSPEPIKQKPTLFADEQNAYNAMISDGLPEQEAISLVKKRRESLASGLKLTPVEATALRQMAQDGLSSEESLQILNNVRSKQKAEETKAKGILGSDTNREGFWQNFAGVGLDLIGGAVSEVPNVLGNTASFLSKAGAYTPMAMLSAGIKAPFSEKTYGQLREEQKQAGQLFQEAGMKGKEFVQSTGLYDPTTTSAKVGETITDIGSAFVGPNKAKILKEGTGLVTKYLPKVLNLAQEGAVMGSKYDIATKGEITKEGAGYGALGNVVFGGTAGIVKKGYDAVKNELPASLTLGGLINPGKLDVVKKSLQVDEGVATPQDVGKWILDRVKPGNKQEIAEQLIQHAEKTKGAVDEALASIPTYFKNPEAKKALLQIRSELEGKAGLESKLAKIDELLAKPDYTLSELNAVKRELDDMYNLYTKTGDPTAGLKAEGLRNIRANIRKFIEDEAEKYGVNIRKLNNETSVARGLADGILRKDSADGVRELLTAFAPSGAGAAIGAGQAIARGEDPLTVLRDALIGGIATKIGTSTAVRTRIASALNRLSEKELTALQTYIRSGGKDAIGKKVAEKVIKEGRALPARTLTKEADFAKPVEKAIITPQTQERAIIEQSKKGLSSNVKRPNGNTNNNLNNTGNISVGSKKIQKSSSKVNPEKTKQNLTPKKESATMGDMENPIIDKQTGETLNQAIEKLRKNNWSERDISRFRESVLGKKESIVKKEGVLDTVNPTGGLFVDYTPGKRANSIISSKDLTTLDKTFGKSPNDYITIYRGTVKGQKEINPGDFITDSSELAKSYAGGNKIVISKRVKYSDIIDSINEGGGNEYLYIPKEMQIWDNLSKPTQTTVKPKTRSKNK